MPQAILKSSTSPIIHRRLFAPWLERTKKPQCKTIPSIFLETLRKSTHLNEKPFRLVPLSNSTITHMAKPNQGKCVPPKWRDGTGMSNSSWQKWLFPNRSEQGKWLNIDNEQDFVGVFKDNFKVISAPDLSSWPTNTKQRQLWVSGETCRK